MGDFQRTVRSDGLTVITYAMPHKNSVRIGVAARVGSAYDPADKEGLFHFFEHMAFKGTATKSQADIASLLDRLFVGSANAYTNLLNTVYGGEAYYERIDDVADILFDMFVHPSFPAEEIEREKNVVENELLRFKDDATSRAIDALDKALWKLNPLRLNGIGSLDTLAAINRDLLLEAHREWYASSNVIVVGVGRLNHEFLAEKAFSSFPESHDAFQRIATVTGDLKDISWNDELDSPPEHREIDIALPREQSTVIIGAKAPKLSEKETVATHILLRMLANGFNSALFQELREKRGLCYGVWGSFEGYRRLGYCVYFTSQTRPEQADEAHNLMREVVYTFPLLQQVFQDARDSVRDNLLVSAQNIHSWEGKILRTLVDEGGNEGELNDYIARRQRIIDDLTLADLAAVRGKVIVPERMVSVLVHP